MLPLLKGDILPRTHRTLLSTAARTARAVSQQQLQARKNHPNVQLQRRLILNQLVQEKENAIPHAAAAQEAGSRFGELRAMAGPGREEVLF
jgi:hypothetical protein